MSFLAQKYCIFDTPIRIKTQKMDISVEIPYLASISNDKSNISFIICNFKKADTNFIINFSNLPWNNDYNIIHYIIDDSKHFRAIGWSLRKTV